MTQSLLQEKDEKFYFHVHNFDEEEVEEEIEEDLPPPPPMFSEEELEAAKKAAFEEGKQAGIQETKSSRSELISGVLATIPQTFSQLFQQEDIRADRYEQEAVKLALRSFGEPVARIRPPSMIAIRSQS